MEQLDAIVIGTGQAAKPLATALAEAGHRTAVIERGRVGGTCVVDGCTPTKTMIWSARVAYLARRAAEFGVRTGEVMVELAAVRRRKRDMVDRWSSGAEEALVEHDGLELVAGEARFMADHEIEVALQDGGERALRADRIFVDTGTRNRVPPIDGLEDVSWLDNASVMELGEVPDHLVVLGGGFVGLEFAQMFRRFGSRVTVIEGEDRLVSQEDADISDAIRGILEEDGMEVLCGSLANAVAPSGAGVRVSLDTEDGGSPREVVGSHLLVAVGRTPNSDDLGLDRTGIERTEAGFIRVDERLRTTVEGVWALGEVAGTPPFTHAAYDDFRIVRENLLGRGDASRAGRVVPYTLYTDPELGRVGMTEREAREEGHEVLVAKIPMDSVARAIETGETRGLMKAVVDAQTDRILGAAVLGVHGGEIASAIQVAMMGGLTWRDLRDGVFAHPTLTESLNSLFGAVEA